jgi:hypothetical protein
VNIIRNEGLDQKSSSLFLSKDAKPAAPAWLKSQLWETIKKVSNKGTVGYDEVVPLYSPIYLSTGEFLLMPIPL